MLEEENECLTDEILVRQVRLQLIVERVHSGTWDGSSKAPFSFYLQALHSEVQGVKDKLPSHLQRNGKQLLTKFAVVLAYIS